jgi:hypothetical protein
VNVGYIEPLADGLGPFIQWNATADGGWSCRVEFTSINAAGLRISVPSDLSRDGVEMRVYEPGTDYVHGPYQVITQPEDDGLYWSPVIFGEQIGLELAIAPKHPAPHREARVVSIAYLFDDGGLREELGCHLDVTCFGAYANAAKAVGHMFFICTPNCGLCTCTLMSRPATGRPPHVLTAAHCINSQALATSLTVTWLFQTSTCNGTPPNVNSPSLPRSNGSLYLKGIQFYDTSLLGLIAPEPPGTTYFPYSTAPWAHNSPAAGIHHPDNTFKRIWFGTFFDTGIQPFVVVGDVSVFKVHMTGGTVEPGSSGSPLLDANQVIRGPLTGGPDGCPPTDKYFGRFDLAMATLTPYLESVASPVWVQKGYVGNESGTSNDPFNTIYEATFAVRSNDSIAIRPGSYAEGFTLYRPMILTAPNGTVVIGQ